MFVYWFLLALLFLICEVGHPGLLFFLSFAFGAFIAGISSFFTQELVYQAALFLAATSGALVVFRRWVAQRGTQGPKHGATNIYALEGKRGLVIKELGPNKFGTVSLNGEMWSARARDDEIVPAGTEVVVLHVKGAHLVVVPNKD